MYLFERLLLCFCLLSNFIFAVIHTPLTQPYYTINGISTNFDDSLEWEIGLSDFPLPYELESIYINIETLNLPTAILTLYKKVSGTTQDIYVCTKCRDPPPQPFIFYGDSIVIKLEGNPSDASNYGTNSFSLTYFGIPKFIQDATPSRMKFNMSINVGYGTVAPVLVNRLIPANSVYSWKIDKSFLFREVGNQKIVSNTNPLQPILLSVSDIASVNCSIFLNIYDGTSPNASALLFALSPSTTCVTPLTWIYAPSGKAYIEMIAPNYHTEDYFRVTWFGVDENVYECGGTPSIDTDTRTDLTLKLNDGTYSGNDMKRSGEGGLPVDGCSWTLIPYIPTEFSSRGSTKQVVMHVLRNNIQMQADIRVYDGDSASGNLIWSANPFDQIVRDNSIIPPPLYSMSGSMFIQYVPSTIAGVFDGWEVEYQTNHPLSQGIGSGEATIRSSTALDIKLPGDNVIYPKSFTYRWNIEPNIQPMGSTAQNKLTFAFRELNLPDCDDNVTLYDGPTINDPILGTYCGTVAPRHWIQSTGTKVLIVFSSDDDNNNTGTFSLSYFGEGDNYHCGLPLFPSPSISTASSLKITDGSHSSAGVFSGEQCQWTLAPDDAEAIYVFFDRFDLTNGRLMVYDGPESDGKLIASYGDTEDIPSPILVKNSLVGLNYQTRDNAYGTGFSLTYFSTTPTATGAGDDTIIIKSSSSFHISVPVSDTGNIPANQELTWLINPSNTPYITGLFFAFAPLANASVNASDFSCTNSWMKIYDGSTINAPLLGKFCASTPPIKWIVTTNNVAFLQFRTGAQSVPASDGNFEVSYFSDASATQCGLTHTPTLFRAPSMILSDGSPSHENATMAPNQNCEWLIEPDDIINTNNNNLDGNEVEQTVVLDFLSVDLRGASLTVYDSYEASNDRKILYMCNSCRNKPRPIISHTGQLYLQFTSESASSVSTFGKGFRAIYTVINDSSTSWLNIANGTVLEMPTDLAFDSQISNDSLIYHLKVGEDSSSLKHYPYFFEHQRKTVSHVDGRKGNGSIDSSYFSNHGDGLSCGNIFTIYDHYLEQGSSLFIQPTQLATSYVAPSLATAGSDRMPILNIRGGDKDVVGRVEDTPIRSAQVCKFWLTSGSTRAIDIKIVSLRGSLSYQIYAGLTGTDWLMYDTNRDFVPPIPHLFTAHCGAAMLVVQYNSTIPNEPYGIMFDYTLKDEIPGSSCLEYIESLRPKEESVDYLTPILIVAFTLLGIFGLIFCFFKVRRHWNGPPKKKKYTVIIPHPFHTPRLDALRNKFLRSGTCVVCNDGPIPVLRLGCSHKICLDCLKGYLESALGDVSMFPVKCPMHYQGCGGEVGALSAKRILARSQYDRFLEFHDRAIYGDGMRCIFCNNYVNFPMQETISMVECPYCIQKFCMICRKPWHYGGKCPLEKLDHGLESWRKKSGASCCPACKKIIEKEDSETCHHMVHKVTDAIPCIRDRTDFCYLCGFEVSGNYPHVEIDNPTVNHFPDGVFQKCRIAVKREKEAERDRMRKERRFTRKSTVVKTSDITTGRVVPDAPSIIWDAGDDAVPLLGASSGDGRPRTSSNSASRASMRMGSPDQLLSNSSSVSFGESPQSSPGTPYHRTLSPSPTR